VLEKGGLRRIFGPNRDEVKGDWRNLHNEEFNDTYSSPSIVPVIKSRRWRGMYHVWGRGAGCTGLEWGNLREREHLGEPGVDERKILRWIFRMWDVRHGLDRAGSG
jgi:hypothetical protein